VAFNIPYSYYPDGRGGALPNVFFSVLLGHEASKKQVPVQGLIDSGAARSIFDARLAKMIGLDLKAGERAAAQGIGGIVEIWLHDVVLHLPGGDVFIRAGFQEDLPVAGLLGMDGFFEHFRITFDGAARQCELERLS
jgi:hypothetical protein